MFLGLTATALIELFFEEHLLRHPNYLFGIFRIPMFLSAYVNSLLFNTNYPFLLTYYGFKDLGAKETD